MGLFIASLLGTVDGFDGNAHFEPTADAHQVFNDLLARTEGVVFDRENYDLLVPYWDEVDISDPALTESDAVEREFAEIFRTKRRYVVSGSLGQDDPLATLIDGDPVGPLRELKAATGDLMVAAGPDLLTVLFNHDLIDEVEILMLPVVLGEGTRQVGSLSRKQPLDLVEARGLPSGAVALHYRVRPR